MRDWFTKTKVLSCYKNWLLVIIWHIHNIIYKYIYILGEIVKGYNWVWFLLIQYFGSLLGGRGKSDYVKKKINNYHHSIRPKPRAGP